MEWPEEQEKVREKDAEESLMMRIEESGGVKSLDGQDILSDPHRAVRELIDGIRPWLPIQNPLSTFAHNNVLMAFEDFSFHLGVLRAARLYGAQPYASMDFYRDAVRKGRILGTVLDRLETRAANRIGTMSVEKNRTSGQTALPMVRTRRLARYWEYRFGAPYTRQLHDWLIPLIASYLDQGLALWGHSYAKLGFWWYFAESTLATPPWTRAWLKGLRERVRELEVVSRDNPAEEVVTRILARFGGARAADAKEYVLESLFDLKGWAGIVNKLETEPGQFPIRSMSIRLMDFVAAKLLCEEALDEYYARKHEVSLPQLHAAPVEVPGHLPGEDVLEELRVLHEAYELSYVLPALRQLENGFKKAGREPSKPDFQVVFCIDDREESLRRILEREAPRCRTYGVVGYFSIDMKFLALRNSRPTMQCPPVIHPTRRVREVPAGKTGAERRRFRKAKHRFGNFLLAGYYQTRVFFSGIAASLSLGLLAIAPLYAKTYFPRLSDKLRERILNWIFPAPPARIELLPEAGFSEQEQAEMVADTLKVMGLTDFFSPVILLVAHGSMSANNPFRQAYGCGACGGNSGQPNSRVFAAMANSPAVRKLLRARGIPVPESSEESVFIAGYHDTCTDRIQMFDVPPLSARQEELLRELTDRLLTACKSNALERSRRFETFRPGPRRAGDARLRAESAYAHVQDRAHDLAQPRPEYGHNRVALCIVGKRELTRELDLERRAFLVSYDADLDLSGEVLMNTVLGAVPVAANISLDYYFSAIDNDGWGAGSKLPLNIASLLGVMTGSKSDLRIGLARQMIEIHEPMRITTLVEARRDRVEKVFFTHPRLSRLVRNEWMRLGIIDPSTREISIYRRHDGHDDFIPLRQSLGEAGLS